MAWASRPIPKWLGQSFLSTGTDTTVRATTVAWTVFSKHRHGQSCPCYDSGLDSLVQASSTDRTVRATLHGLEARATQGVGKTPTL
ncbi:MAG: hypothetical protein NZ556_07725 [Fimbriimonadales bacterium]|nr:hypothetical protein [Fimbriimonadales bacterium]